MPNKNIGLIINIKQVKDNDLYIKILSDKDEIISGIVYGGNSSKKKFIYQICNFIEYNRIIKNHNSISSINGEIISPFVINILNDKFKLLSLLAMVSIINKSLYDGQKNLGLFISIKKTQPYGFIMIGPQNMIMTFYYPKKLKLIK